ncbi:hypothetical protein QQY66_16745 [Streptomyces sp. DG2A-72]|uniref:hypothetical protein n=1 Tax=Streptomyces sp. DG2A-72 TaxID=3051386 RepID=UPI00265BAD9F|nr:hypothetical protein [Streptomyces sp. DG2A-72]MDO0933254.1 hypothetical protein [Streptomyces sp. DG2A-72]
MAQRRLMVRAADRLAREQGAQALVTGDKEEILAEASRLGTADISRLPDEDRCTLLLPRPVATRTTPGQLTRIEQRLDLDDMVDRAAS